MYVKHEANKKLNHIENPLAYICQNEYEYFLNKSNVEGIGIGYKIINGFNTFEECINVFVRKKRVNLNYYDLIPKMYKGFKTDVKESGIASTDGLTSRMRPVVQGYSISLSPYSKLSTTIGTTGCLVTDGTNNYLLSNNHILAEYGLAPINNYIMQPARGDGGFVGVDEVGILSKYIPLKYISTLKKPSNYVDCAIAKVVPKSMASPRMAIIGQINDLIIPVLNKSVMKIGRTTALTRGRVVAIKATMKVMCTKIGKISLMKNQVLTTKMTYAGDSGALLLDDNKNIMGLVMGSTDTVSICNDIHDVLKALNVRIVTN